MGRPAAQVCSTELVGEWTVQHRRGSAADLHEVGDLSGDRRLVQVNEVSRAAMVLGSTQPETDVDRARLERRGIDLARRRSGGGAVLLVPGEHVWVDVVLPAGDPLWSDDVSEASWWLGERWVDALGAGRRGSGALAVHRGRLQGGDLARLVCFAGVGPGEVVDAGRKLVGISQRRTRTWARFQCVVHLRWDPAATLGLMSVRPDGLDGALQERVVALGPTPEGRDGVVRRLLRRLG